MTRERQIVEVAKAKEKETGFGELVKSSVSRGVNSAYGIGFLEGVEWADQNPKKGLWDANKVVKFIRENVREYHKSGVFHVDGFINDLRKAMED